MVIDDASVVTQAIVDLILPNKDDLGLAAVGYGDPSLIPGYPAVFCETGPKVRTKHGTNFHLAFTVLINVHHGKMQEASVTKKESEELAEAIEDILHANKTLDSKVVFGWVSRIEPGFTLKAQEMLRTTRLVWEATGYPIPIQIG